MSRPGRNIESTEQGKGLKRGTDDAELDKVHSANNWEGANLGDDERRQKFLRLMGAKKKEHHGRFVIGENNSKHGRSDDETSRLNRQLERQYTTGLDLKLSGAARHHSGLGFKTDDEPTDAVPSSASSSSVPTTAKESKTQVAGECREEYSQCGQNKDLQKEEKDKTLTISTAEELKAEGTNGKEKLAQPESTTFSMNFVKASN